MNAHTFAEWHELAVCRGVDPEIFFPDPSDHGTEAKAYCARCPVRGRCLEYALTLAPSGNDAGVWGGTTARERQRIRRARKRQTA